MSNETNLKPHTIVKIREDLKQGLHNEHYVTKKMLDFKGMLATITEVVPLDNNDEDFLYSLSVDNGRYWWKQENFEEGIYSPVMFLANELGLTYNEIVSDYKNNTGKNEGDVVIDEELEEYIKTRYGKFL